MDVSNSRTFTRDRVYRILRDQITNLELKPGAGMSEKDIAEKLQVSRTPVREAFMRLAQEELVEVYAQKGTFVSRIDLDYVEEARFIRENIEKAVARLACEQFSDTDMIRLQTSLQMQKLSIENKEELNLFALDDEFHALIFEGCGKMRTLQMIQHINTHFNRIRLLRLNAIEDWENILSQHTDIAEAISRSEADKAEQAMQEHLRLVWREKEAVKQAYPNYFK